MACPDRKAHKASQDKVSQDKASQDKDQLPIQLQNKMDRISAVLIDWFAYFDFY